MPTLICRECGVTLSRPLVWLVDESRIQHEDGEEIVPMGTLWQSDGDYYPAGEWVIHRDDLINCQLHHEKGRLQGCCGLDGCDGPNRLCENGHEVATERSDCWWAHGVHLNPSQADLSND